MTKNEKLQSYHTPIASIILYIASGLIAVAGLIVLFSNPLFNSIAPLTIIGYIIIILVCSSVLFAIGQIVDELSFQNHQTEYYGEQQLILQQQILRELKFGEEGHDYRKR